MSCSERMQQSAGGSYKSNTGPLDSKSDTLPLCHRAPPLGFVFWQILGVHLFGDMF